MLNEHVPTNGVATSTNGRIHTIPRQNLEAKQLFSLLSREDGQVFEIRGVNAMLKTDKKPYDKPRIISGYFDDADTLATAITAFDDTSEGVYITINPCKEGTFSRAANRLNGEKGLSTTADAEIEKRQILFLDCDPEREGGIRKIPTNNNEHQAALDFIEHLAAQLDLLGWPQPIEIDSGNGGYLILAVDLPADDDGLIQRVLAGLAQRFDTEQVHIDLTAFNQARIMRVPGTWNCKADSTKKRPHRQANIISMPETLEVVTREQLEAVAAPAEEEPEKVTQAIAPAANGLQKVSNRPASSEDFLNDFLSRNNINTRRETGSGYTRYVLIDGCVFNETHRGKDAAVIIHPNQTLGYKCFHNSCAGKSWEDFAKRVEPGYMTSKEKNEAYEAAQAAKAQLKLVKPAKKKASDEEDDTQPAAPKEPSALTRLMEITKRARYITTSSGDLYARVPVRKDEHQPLHYEVVSISEHGSGFRRWLTFIFKQMYGTAPNSEALSLCMSGVFADAEYTGERAKIHVRLAYHKQTNKIYLDMANDDWQVIEISCGGWRVISSKECPVYFIRPNGVLPLPTPVRGASLHDNLKKIINPKTEKDYILMVGWLLGTLHPRGPYTALNLNGEKGSMKSTTTRLFRSIVDPNIAATRGPQRDGMELAILAQSNHIVALDNLSSFPLWLSDAFCRLCTGSGDGKKKLYTDKDEIIFSIRRPAIINGIDDGLITYADMLDRTILVTLEPPAAYLSEDEVDARFEKLHPKILGALLDAAAASMKNQASVTLELPRMADFARWVTAAEPVLGWEQGTFIDAFVNNQESSTSIVVETSPTAIAIIQFMSQRAKWDGSMKELLDELTKYDVFSQAKTSPKTANKLSGQVKRIIAPMKVQGLNITPLGRDSHGSKISIEKVTYTTRKSQPASVDKQEPSVDNNSRNVDKTPSSVDKMADSVDKNSGYLHPTDPDIEPSDTNGRANSVDSVDKMPDSSTTLPKHSKEKIEEERETDEANILSTLSTSEDTITCAVCHIPIEETEDFQFDNDGIGYCSGCWQQMHGSEL